RPHSTGRCSISCADPGSSGRLSSRMALWFGRTEPTSVPASCATGVRLAGSAPRKNSTPTLSPCVLLRCRQGESPKQKASTQRNGNDSHGCTQVGTDTNLTLKPRKGEDWHMGKVRRSGYVIEW